MSKQIDLSKPLSDEDKEYLVSRGRQSDILRAEGKDASALTAGPSFDANTDPAELLAKTPNTGDVNTLGREAGAPDTSVASTGEDAEESEYDALTVPQLRDELARRDLPTAGKKPELVARLVEDDQEDDGEDDDDAEDNTNQ